MDDTTIRLRTMKIAATDTAGEKVRVYGPKGYRTYPYEYSAYDMHDTAVMVYLLEEMKVVLSQDDLFALTHPRRRLTFNGRGFVYLIPSKKEGQNEEGGNDFPPQTFPV